MQDSAKYLIHADIRASGVVERSDVVGAIFGQTEGLLGDELDLRDLQESSKVGRIDVEIDSEAGRSYGTLTIASGLDRVETAVLAAALETIDRIGPCRAEFEVHDLEDVRAAKRQRVVDRATELLAEFEETSLSSRELVEEVRQNVRVADITEFEGVPAGPRVAESDAIVVVEGRADVLQLLKYGVKNAIAVEGTDVPDAVAELTRERTVTAFLDGDRGGDLILEELVQVGSIDYVAIAPAGRSVEDLSRGEVLSALREKILYDRVADASSPRDVLLEDEGPPDGRVDADGGTLARGASTDPTVPEDTDPDALAGHTEAVDGTGTVRLLDETFDALAEADAGETFAAIEDAETVPHAVVLDGELSQRVLDVAAQRGVRQIVADSEGEFVKRPTGVRVRTADEF
ncbi:DNA primase [Halobacteriales archaeon SW_10_68_16]|nr:MAG: DNA primase [Halobacteriales archaeon SW_10_68_16]